MVFQNWPKITHLAFRNFKIYFKLLLVGFTKTKTVYFPHNVELHCYPSTLYKFYRDVVLIKYTADIVRK